MEGTLRLQVFLSHSGVCSRRRALELIQAGHVTVNGTQVLEPSTPVKPGRDQVTFDGKIVGAKKYEYILLNKPMGVTTTKMDRFAEKTVMDLLPQNLSHLNPVGRLDKDTEGLLLLTNDGQWANRLTHPSFEVDKTYFVEVKGALEQADIRRLESGFLLDQVKTAPARIEKVVRRKDVTEFKMTIHEGRKRQVRLMLLKIGHPVIRLKRLSQGPFRLGDLKPGEFRSLTKEEITVIIGVNSRRIGVNSRNRK